MKNAKPSSTKSSQPMIFGQEPQAPAYQHPQKPDFELWWSPIARKFGFKAPTKQAVILHFKARGFWESKEWAQGMRDFGYKID